MTKFDTNGHALLLCPGCKKETTFTLTLTTTVSYPFVEVDGIDVVGDPKHPVYGYDASLAEAYCNVCLQPVSENELRILAGAEPLPDNIE